MFKSVVENLKEFDQSVAELKQQWDPLLKKPISEVLGDVSPIQKAKLQLVLLYSLNSTVWAYLRLIGKDPKNLAIKQELDRVRDYMKRAKEVEDQLVAGEPTIRVNKEAAKRTVKHALWQAAQGKNKQPEKATKQDDVASSQEPTPSQSQSNAVEGNGNKNEKMSEKDKSPQKRKSYVVDQYITEADEPEPATQSKPKEPTPSKRQRSAKLD